MWIDEDADLDCLRAWIKYCSAMKFVTTTDGKFIWANTSFCEWSQFTLHELQRFTIKSIENSSDDDSMIDNMSDGYSQTYSMKTQLSPKGSSPEWGFLASLRYPLSGDIKYCLWTWDPMQDSSFAAFKQAMDSSDRVEKRMAEMAEILKLITAQTDEDRWVLSTINLIRRNPKLAAFFLVMALGMFGLNNALELLQRTGLIEIPIRVEKTAESPVGDAINHANDIVRHY